MATPVVRQLVYTRSGGGQYVAVISKWQNQHTVAQEAGIDVSLVPQKVANDAGQALEIMSESYVVEGNDGTWVVIPAREIIQIKIEVSEDVG